MNPRGLRRYIQDLLRGRRPRAFRPDDFEAAQIRTAIDLQAARPGADAPRPEFLADLHRQTRRPARRRVAEGIGATVRHPQAGHRRHVRGGRCHGCCRVGRQARHARREPHRRAERRRRAHPQRRELAEGRRQLGRSRRCHASVRPRIRDRFRPPSRRQAGGRLRGVHSPGLPAVVRRDPTTGCAARAIRPRSRPPARC